MHPSGAHRLAARAPSTPDGPDRRWQRPGDQAPDLPEHSVHQPRDLTGLHDLIAIGTHPDPRTEPPPDLAAQVRALLRLTTTSVPSCSGVRLSLTRDNLPVTVTALTLDAGLEPVRSSLAIRLPHNPLVHSALTNSTSLPPGRSLPAGAELVLYASCRRAFHTVAVDLLALLDLDPRRAVLDRHLALPDLADAADTLAAQLDDCSAVERAVGVLLARGLPWARAGRNSPGVPPPTGTIFPQPPVSSCAHSPDPPPATHPGTTAATHKDRPRQPVRSTKPPTARVRPAPPPISPAQRCGNDHVQNSAPLTPVLRCTRTVLPASARRWI